MKNEIKNTLAWSELEMIFGVQKNEPSIELQEKDLQEKDVREKSTGSLLNQDMVIGLRHMFRYHRDYLYVVAKDLSVSGLPNYDQKEIESEVISSFSFFFFLFLSFPSLLITFFLLVLIIEIKIQ